MRIAVVDDHRLFVDGMVSWLAQHAPDLEVVYAGGDHRAALAVADQVDAVLLDLDLGADTPPVSALVSAFVGRGSRVLVVSAMKDGRVARQAINAGALGYVPKRESSETMLEGLRAVHAGELFLTRDLAAVLTETGDEIPDLSPQELRALRLYASGLKLDTVARRMGIAPGTAREYLDRVRRKYEALGRRVRTKGELGAAARRDHLIADDGPP